MTARGPYFWTLMARLERRPDAACPVRIAMVEAKDADAAARLLPDARLGPVNRLTSPERITDLLHVDPGTVLTADLDRTPSAWDEVEGMTRQEMEDRGFDPF